MTVARQNGMIHTSAFHCKEYLSLSSGVARVSCLKHVQIQAAIFATINDNAFIKSALVKLLVCPTGLRSITHRTVVRMSCDVMSAAHCPVPVKIVVKGAYD